MTRFCGDAVGVRSGKSHGYSTKDLKKNMEKFQATGQHPDVQRSRSTHAAMKFTPLPEHDANRDYVFITLQQGEEELGQLVVELFADHHPVGANHLRNRCLPGSKAGLQGTTVHKLQPNYAAWLGRNPAAGEGMRVTTNSRLRHVDAGAVSVSLDGSEVAVSLGRALVLDTTHQVVGRVHRGLDLLEALSHVPTNHMDVPLQRIMVSKSGLTNAAGVHESLDQSGGGVGSSKQDVATRLVQQSADTRQAVKAALAAAGLGKRKAGSADASTDGAAEPSSSHAKEQAPAEAVGSAAEQLGRVSAVGAPDTSLTTGASAQAVKPAAAPQGGPGSKKARAAYLDTMLGGAGGEDDSESSSDESSRSA